MFVVSIDPREKEFPETDEANSGTEDAGLSEAESTDEQMSEEDSEDD